MEKKEKKGGECLKKEKRVIVYRMIDLLLCLDESVMMEWGRRRLIPSSVLPKSTGGLMSMSRMNVLAVLNFFCSGIFTVANEYVLVFFSTKYLGEHDRIIEKGEGKGERCLWNYITDESSEIFESDDRIEEASFWDFFEKIYEGECEEDSFMYFMLKRSEENLNKIDDVYSLHTVWLKLLFDVSYFVFVDQHHNAVETVVID